MIRPTKRKIAAVSPTVVLGQGSARREQTSPKPLTKRRTHSALKGPSLFTDPQRAHNPRLSGGNRDVKDDPIDVPFGVNQLPAGHFEAEAAAARGTLGTPCAASMRG